MAKYQKYAEYKDSAIKEIGVIPKHWDISKVKFLAKCLDGQRIPLNGTERGERSGTVPYWGANKIVDYVNDWIFDEELVLLGEDGAPFFDTTKDVAFAINGKIWPNNHVHVLRPNRLKVGIKYLTYSLNCTDYSLYISGSTRDKLNQSDMDNILIRMPSLIEQSQIANFLDHETAQIDTLIVKQEKLIELLKEKRQAVISHVVTKGLNPNVAMKDSGVEWLGQVPEHWKVMQFRRITSLSQGLQIPQSERLHEPNDNTVEYITIKSLNAKDDAYKEYIYKASDRVTCGKSDVLLARTGATGEVVTNVSGAFHNNFFKVSYSNDILRDFLVYILKVKELKSHLLMLAGTTTIPDLNHGAFLGTQIALPSLTEQQEIIDFIDDYLRRSMILEGKARSAIQLMQERRTALISSAVTGKIDVRNWQNPNEAKTEFSA